MTTTKKKAAVKKPAKGNFFSKVLHKAQDQIDEFVDSAKHKAKEVKAKEKKLEKQRRLGISKTVGARF